MPAQIIHMQAAEVIERYFLENRARVIEIAAFLDRVGRASGAGAEAAESDFRLISLRNAVGVLLDGGGNKAARAQLAFSDLSTEPIESAAGMKGACGAWKGVCATATGVCSASNASCDNAEG
ncbi:MAG: hypothetical protein HZA20_01160 [Nitrospirae bacterium]|nr:hypothetical protein [Nitrospirota bacterium]